MLPVDVVKPTTLYWLGSGCSVSILEGSKFLMVSLYRVILTKAEHPKSDNIILV